jgi:alpha-glucosidase (family GH31 glycosyl hydrolase)
MNKYRTFEYDQENFKDLPAFVDGLHKSNRYYVPIVDAGFAYRPDSDYTAFLEA